MHRIENNVPKSASSTKLEITDLCNTTTPCCVNTAWEAEPFYENATINEAEKFASLIIERMRKGTSGAEVLRSLTSRQRQFLDDTFFRLEFLYTLEESGDECESNGRIADAISIFELLILCFERGISLSEEHTMHWTCAFARMLIATGEIDRAKKYCRQATKIYESQPLNIVISPANANSALSNQRSLIKLLQICDCGIEVESLLLRRLCRMIENFWECNAEIIQGMAKSLIQINDKISKDSNTLRREVVLELKNFTLNLYPRRFVPLDSLPLLHSLIGIAAAYSESGAFKEADLIFELLLLFENGKLWQPLGSSASRLHLEYSQHFIRQGQKANAASEFSLSMRSIASGNDTIDDGHEEELVEWLRCSFERVKTKAGIDGKLINHQFWTECEKALERRDAALLRKDTKDATQKIEADVKGKPTLRLGLCEDCRQRTGVLLPTASDHDLESLGEYRGAPKSPHTAPRSVLSWPSSRSYKYGITYSVSNCTGISDSEFMIP